MFGCSGGLVTFPTASSYEGGAVGGGAEGCALPLANPIFFSMFSGTTFGGHITYTLTDNRSKLQNSGPTM